MQYFFNVRDGRGGLKKLTMLLLVCVYHYDHHPQLHTNNGFTQSMDCKSLIFLHSICTDYLRGKIFAMFPNELGVCIIYCLEKFDSESMRIDSTHSCKL